MASATPHTDRSHLTLVAPSGAEPERDTVKLAASPRLRRFLDASAAVGLGPEEAVSIALNRALSLSDGAELCGDIEVARRRLSAAAVEAKASGPSSADQAARIRRLIAARPVPQPEFGEELAVRLDGRQLGRTSSLSEASLRPEIVSEMVSWELAATLARRPMTEWALWVLARGPRRRA